MSLARSLADLISGNAVIEATEIADNTITGGKLATDIVINTTGSITSGALTSCNLSYPTADGTSGQVIQTDGAGNLTFATASGGGGLADVVDDLTPQLGGNLDLNGNSICGFGGFNITGSGSFSNDLIVNTNSLYVDSTNNRVGIGTSSPSVKLEILGTLNQADTQTIRLMEDTSLGSFIKYDGNVNELQLGGFSSGEIIGIRIARNDATTMFNTGGSERMRIDSSGNVGIGTSSPTAKLHVNGAIVGGALTSCGLSYPTADGTSGQVIQTDGAGNLTFATVSGGGGGLADVVDDLTPQLGGNLDLNGNNICGSGNINVSGCLCVNGTGAFYGSLAVDTDALYVNCFSNNVGIGTAYPNSNLHIANSLDPTITLEDTSGDNQSRMRFLTATKCFVIGLHGGSSKFRISCGTTFGGSADWFSVCNTGQVDVTCNLVVGGALTACGLSYPTADGTSGQVIQTDGAGNLTFATVSGGSGLADVVDDTTPQLGGNLDLNGNSVCGLGQICILADLNKDLYIMRCNATCINLQLGVGDFSATFVKANGLKPFRLINASTEATHGIEFFTCNTERMRLTNAGYLGIGTTSAATKLHVENGEITISDGTTCHQIGTSGCNMYFGGNALTSLTSGTLNTAIGFNALCSVNSGTRHIAIGAGAGTSMTGGYDNIAIGCGALASVITEHSNVAIGSCALNATTGYANIGIGRFALLNATGSQNVAIGAEAGCCLTTHIRSTIIGSYAAKNIQANSNTIIGFCALGLATAGDCNTVVGTCAMLGSSSTTGYGNTAVGNCAAFSLTTGLYNVAVGDGALKCNQTGRCNVAIGNFTLESNTGSCNTALGSRALQLVTGNGNTAVGFRVFGALTTGVRNVGVGFESGLSMTGGSDNTVMGSAALFNNVSGNANVAVGRQALAAATGSNNTAIGFYSGCNITSGSNLTTVGCGATASSATATNEVTLGNVNVTSLRANVTTISSLSDQRDKTNVCDLNVGLCFVNDLRPVTFDWDRRDGTMAGHKDVGFIAQDLDALQQKYDIEENLKIVLKENPERLEASPGKLIPILVKAIQELSAEVKKLKENK